MGWKDFFQSNLFVPQSSICSTGYFSISYYRPKSVSQIRFLKSFSRICLSNLFFKSEYVRRLVKRIYVPLPDEEARAGLIRHLMKKQGSGGGGIVEDPEKLNAVVQMTGGYSGSDLSAVRSRFKQYDSRTFILLIIYVTSFLQIL